MGAGRAGAGLEGRKREQRRGDRVKAVVREADWVREDAWKRSRTARPQGRKWRGCRTSCTSTPSWALEALQSVWGMR